MRRVLIALGVAVALAAATPGLAHGPTGAAPAPGSTVGPGVTEVLIVFPELMTADGMSVSVTGPEGEELTTGAPELDPDEQVVRTPVLALEPGVHRVDYEVSGIDGVTTPGAYLFTVEVGAPPPAAVNVPEPVLTADSGGPNWPAFGAGIVAAMLLWLFVGRNRVDDGGGRSPK